MTVVRTALVFCFLLGSMALSADPRVSNGLDPETSQAIEASHQCVMEYGRLCAGYASRPGVQVRRAPRKDAPVIAGGRIYDRGELILLLEPRPTQERPDWVRVETVVNQERAAIGWLPRTDVILEADLRKVIGCWPISGISWHQIEAGETPEKDVHLRFTPEGEVFELGIGDEPVPTTHGVYYAQGIFRIRDESEYGLDYDIIGLLFPQEHRAELHLDLGMLLDPPYTMVDREKLSGCKAIPVLDLKAPRITKRKRY